jgi:hypothetical protein
VTDKQAEIETDDGTATEFAQRLFSEADLDLKKETINAIKVVLKAVEARIGMMRTELVQSRKS